MRALAIYIALTAVAINVAGNAMSNSAEGLKKAQEARMNNLCEVNRIYCR